MMYYRVKPEYDQTQRIKRHRYAAKRVPLGIFIANELYTARELMQFDLTNGQAEYMFEAIRIPKNQIYWFFGARFQKQTSPWTQTPILEGGM